VGRGCHGLSGKGRALSEISLGMGRVNRSMWGPPRPPKPSHTRGTTLLLLVCSAMSQISATSSELHVCWQSLPQKREEKTTLSGVDSMRSQVLYWAAHQNLCHTDAALHCTITQAAAHSEGKPSTSQRAASQNHRAATTPWEREQIQVLEQWQC